MHQEWSCERTITVQGRQFALVTDYQRGQKLCQTDLYILTLDIQSLKLVGRVRIRFATLMAQGVFCGRLRYT